MSHDSCRHTRIGQHSIDYSRTPLYHWALLMQDVGMRIWYHGNYAHGTPAVPRSGLNDRMRIARSPFLPVVAVVLGPTGHPRHRCFVRQQCCGGCCGGEQRAEDRWLGSHVLRAALDIARVSWQCVHQPWRGAHKRAW